MAVRVSSEVTVTDQTDAVALITWYQLSSSPTKPSKPTTTDASVTPTNWSKAEPSFNPNDGTRYLYTSLQTVWGDGTCDWGDVQLSSAYEQAKQAWNAANAAKATADSVEESVSDLSDALGPIDAPYTEVEWVESNGTQYVYTDWKPPVNTWGFEADFIIRNTFSTSAGAWRADTNVNGFGNVFGTRNASGVNDMQLGSYGSSGALRIGSSASVATGMLTDRTSRQTIKLIGTTLTKPNGTTATVTRLNETADKPYSNMAVFCMHDGLRRGATGGLAQPGTVRIYSLKFYESTTMKMHLVGAIRNSDGATGLYDKVAGHFYPALGMTHGDAVGSLREPDTVAQALAKRDVKVRVDNRTNTRMWTATVPTLDRLEDGQQITVTYSTGVTSSKPGDVGLVGWDEGAGTNYSNVYLKLTLADGSVTDWIPCYYSSGTRLTTHYAAGTPILLTYRENALYASTTTSAGTAVVRAWYADPNYVDGNTVYTKYTDASVAGLNGLKRYQLCMMDENGRWTSICNQANSTASSGKTCYAGGLKLGKVLYHITAGDYAAGANGGVLWESYGGIDLRYSVNGVTNAAATTTLQYRKPVYLVGTVHDDGLFYLDATQWWTQDPADASKVYVLVGSAYTSPNAIFLAAENPAYVILGNELVEYDDSRIRGIQNHFWFDSAGAHVGEVDGLAGVEGAGRAVTIGSLGILLQDAANTLASFAGTALNFYQNNVLAASHTASGFFTYVAGKLASAVTSSGMLVYDQVGIAAANVVASFGADGAQIGKSSAAHTDIDANGMRIYAGNGTTTVADLGYGASKDAEGQTSNNPYYTLGNRASGSGKGAYSLAQGQNLVASGYCSHAEGTSCAAEGDSAHSEGFESTASGHASHVEGMGNTASGDMSHAEGFGVVASGNYSHAEGINTVASGFYSHAEGLDTTASGNNAHAQNSHTTAAYESQTAMGEYNANSSNNLLEIGNGTADNARSNAFAVRRDGTVDTAQDAYVTSAPATVFSADSGLTVTEALYYRRGQVAMLTVTVKATTAKSGSWSVGTVVSGKRPAIMTYGSSSLTAIEAVRLYAGGGVSCIGSLAQDASVTLAWTYVVG